MGRAVVAPVIQRQRGDLTFDAPAPDTVPTPRAKSDQQIKHELAIAELASQVSARRLPQPVCSHLFDTDPKRKWRLDLAFVDYKVALECEVLAVRRVGDQISRQGPTVASLRANHLKQGNAAVQGWLLLRTDHGRVTDEGLFDRLTQLLRMRGWRPGDKPLTSPAVEVNSPARPVGAIARLDCPTCGPQSFFRGLACVTCGHQISLPPLKRGRFRN